MNMHKTLKALRKFRNLTPTDVASVINVTVDFYKNLENGKHNITEPLAQKLSDFYKLPIVFFIKHKQSSLYSTEIIYTNCTFSGNGSSGYVNHQYNYRGIEEIIAAKNSEIKILKQEVEALRIQNSKLLDLIEKQQNRDIVS
jgi:transcriptional regulator with XRE-family HTH domain